MLDKDKAPTPAPTAPATAAAAQGRGEAATKEGSMDDGLELLFQHLGVGPPNPPQGAGQAGNAGGEPVLVRRGGKLVGESIIYVEQEIIYVEQVYSSRRVGGIG